MSNTRGAVLPYRYRIFETQEYLDCLLRFSKTDRGFIEKKAGTYIYPQLRQEPHFGVNIKKLAGYDPETWRYRLGRFRLFYSIDDRGKIVYILTIDFRKDAYR
jgi:mRNA interferase RelE/StbE